ncbi:MAG: hypothetical protein ACE5R6_17320 [Candidatus Heimdallarchaeota archaeon]
MIDQTVKMGLIQIEECDQKFLQKYAPFGLKGGELAVVALYFQLKADLITSNDDHVRRLRTILQLNLISSPEIIVFFAHQGKITPTVADEALRNLKKIGWFHPSVIDYARQEVRKYE